MPILHLLTFLTYLLLPSQDDPLKAAKQKLESSKSISYHLDAEFWNGNGTAESSFSCNFEKSPTALGYQFVIKDSDADYILLDDFLREVRHNDKKLVTFSPEQTTGVGRGFIPFVSSPMIFFKDNPKLAFEKDTLIANEAFAKYLVVYDTTLEDGVNYVRRNSCFISKKSFFVTSTSSEVFHNGELMSRVSYRFKDYSFNNSTRAFDYAFPEGFVTVMFGSEPSKLLKEGEQAPLFTAKDLNGNTISLEQLRGKKVLLNFSFTGCGYCKKAIDAFKSPEFKIQPDIEVVYINPHDTKSMMTKYNERFGVPFPIIAEAKEIGKVYGVEGFPCFYLINSQGIIEKVVLGFDKSFIDGLAQR